MAWAVGDFEYVEATTDRKYNGKGIPVRVYTTRGLKEQARFALECAHRTVDYFSDVFGIDYPLPKSDLLAVHEFVGYLFNWVLTTPNSLKTGHGRHGKLGPCNISYHGGFI